MSLLSKQDLVLKKIIKAIEEDRKQVILQLGNYYKSYMNNLHISGRCLYLDNRLVTPACLRSTMLHQLHEARPVCNEKSGNPIHLVAKNLSRDSSPRRKLYRVR